MKVLKNAHVWQNGGFARLDLLIEGKFIKALLPANQDAYPDYQTIDLASCYIYPGFVDTHTHSFEGGLYALGVNLQHLPDISSVLDTISAAVQDHQAEEPIFAWQFDETELFEQRYPTLAELDAVCPDRPLILRRIDGHSCILNSHARKLLPGSATQSEILRGAENDQAVHYFHSRISEEQILAAYTKAAELALKGGFTGLHTMVGDAAQSIGHYSLLNRHLEHFPIHYTLYPQSFNLKAALEAGATRIGGCILADGSIGSGTAALSEAYIGTDNFGTLYHDQAFWLDFIRLAHQHDLQVAVHCIGDAAIRQINSVYLQLMRQQPKDLRHQLIHCELTPDNLMQEIVMSQAVPVMQPNFDLLWGGDDGFYARKLGQDRSRMMNRFGTFTRQGIRITGGSDWYITALDAVLSIRAAMQHLNPAERLTHAQSVDIYTRNSAWLAHEEQHRGEIKAGYIADLTVLSHALDDFDNQPQVRMVLTNGSIQYESNTQSF